MPSPNQRQFTELTGWLASRPESLRAFGLRAAVDKSVLSKLINGKMRRWDPALIARITVATDGRVTFAEFVAFGTRLAEVVKAKPRVKRRAA